MPIGYKLVYNSMCLCEFEWIANLNNAWSIIHRSTFLLSYTADGGHVCVFECEFKKHIRHKCIVQFVSETWKWFLLLFSTVKFKFYLFYCSFMKFIDKYMLYKFLFAELLHHYEHHYEHVERIQRLKSIEMQRRQINFQQISILYKPE